MLTFFVYGMVYLCLLTTWKNVNGGISLKDLQRETDMLTQLSRLKYHDSYLMFWRPQKVGSSTLLGIILSHSYRYNLIPRAKGGKNSFCAKVLRCSLDNRYANYTDADVSALRSVLKSMKASSSRNANAIQAQTQREQIIESIMFSSSLNHEICNAQYRYIKSGLECAFLERDKKSIPSSAYNLKQVFIVRDPLRRMISIYYFWGELAKLSLHMRRRTSSKQNISEALRLTAVSSKNSGVVKAGLFTYHGDESSPPDDEIAIAFAKRFPLYRGMPGPSFTWSAFSNNVKEAVAVLQSLEVMAVVTERLDESLVVFADYMNWSLADVVYTAHRKALSKHPKHDAWPRKAVNELDRKLRIAGEYDVYSAANIALDARIANMIAAGIDFQHRLELFRSLRKRVSEVNIFLIYSSFFNPESTCITIVGVFVGFSTRGLPQVFIISRSKTSFR
jgi:hypothetical protein